MANVPTDSKCSTIAYVRVFQPRGLGRRMAIIEMKVRLAPVFSLMMMVLRKRTWITLKLKGSGYLIGSWCLVHMFSTNTDLAGMSLLLHTRSLLAICSVPSQKGLWDRSTSLMIPR